jgi:citrate lyase subunit beta/citryl-CoA lyase
MTRLLRSVLFVPGVRHDRFAHALAAGADAVVFDLEDSVEASRKAEAREAIAAFLSAAPESTAMRLVRINGVGSPWFGADLEFASQLVGIQGVVLPKAEAPGDVEEVAREVGSRSVIPLIETARGVLHASAIAAAKAPIPAVLFGAEDLTAQIGVPRTVDGEEVLFARSQVVLAATAAGADPIDAVFVTIGALDELQRDARRARALGFRGKMAIHPSQIGVINEVFSPSAAEVDRARRLVDAYDAAHARGEAVLRLDNQMIDTPLVIRARRVLDLADTLASRPPAAP